MVLMSKERDQEPHLFEDIRRTNLDDIPKDWNNKRSTYERLRRIKKEDFETLVMFFFIVVPFLIFTDGGVNSNYTYGATGAQWSDLSIVNSVFGCTLILIFPVLRLISTALTFFVSKTLVQNVMRIMTMAYFALFILYSFIMIFVFNYIPGVGNNGGGGGGNTPKVLNK